MAKPNHAKRSRPRSEGSRHHRILRRQVAERRTRRELERWRRR